MKSDNVLAWGVGVATIVGAMITVLTYCAPPSAPKPDAVTPPLQTKPAPRLSQRPHRLPLDHFWKNASGPQTFALSSSAAVVEDGKFGKALHVRFALRNNSKVAVKAWARSESSRRGYPIEGWTIDAGTTICSPQSDQFTVLPVGDPDENLFRYNDSGSVLKIAPVVASLSDLQFTARFECETPIENDSVLFATVRLTVGRNKSRRTVYFQTSALPVYSD